MFHGGLSLCAVVLVALVAGRHALPQIRIENEDLGLIGRLAAPGCLTCDGGEVEYRIPDADVFALAFTAAGQTTPHNAWVESVWFGYAASAAAAGAACSAYRYPRNNPIHLQRSFAISLTYRECGFATVNNLTTGLISHTSRATIVLRLPTPSPAIIRRKTFQLEVRCSGSTLLGVTVPTSYFERVIPIGTLEGLFELDLSAKVRKERRDTFLTEVDIIVHVITVELNYPHTNNYDIIGHRCWVTNTSDPLSLSQFEIISGRGCNPFDDFTTVNASTPGKYVYTFKDFKLAGDSNDLYFHCEVNVCSKHAPNEGHCTASPDCDYSRAMAGPHKNDAPNLIRATSAVVRNDPDHPPRYRINAQGRPELIAKRVV